jgi:hypothetical protein
MKEKALASTLIVGDDVLDFTARCHRPRSRARSYSCRLGGGSVSFKEGQSELHILGAVHIWEDIV